MRSRVLDAGLTPSCSSGPPVEIVEHVMGKCMLRRRVGGGSVGVQLARAVRWGMAEERCCAAPVEQLQLALAGVSRR